MRGKVILYNRFHRLLRLVLLTADLYEKEVDEQGGTRYELMIYAKIKERMEGKEEKKKMHSAAFDGRAQKSAEGIYTTVVSYRLFLLREKEWK